MSTARAPGKLILTGEHAVVHGCPAIVTAIDREIRVRLPQTPEDTGDMNETEFRIQIDQRYAEFQSGQRLITEVLGEGELLRYALAAVQHQMVTVDSSIPTGCGMGSSAALVLAIGRAAGLAGAELLALVDRTENLQHGSSSGLDARVCFHGGVHHYQAGTLKPFACDQDVFTLLNTGTPLTSTGECVALVHENWPESDPIWDDFRAVAASFEAGIHADAIRENHRLLCRIGVVPEAVQSVITELESAGCAAKICGAGAVRGDHAGIVWILGEDVPEHFDTFTVQTDLRGVERIA